MKRSLSFEVWIRRALGVAVIIGVIAIALGWDTNLLTKFSFVNTSKAEAHLINALGAEKPAARPVSAAGSQPVLADEGPLPELSGAVAWLNSAPLTRESLRGKVVLIDFWTYSCINCLRALPYIEAWATKYKDAGLVVIGVHTPEFAFEKERTNVEKAVRDLKVNYPVAIDSNYKIWQAFNNEYWPAHYFIDGKGRIRYHHFGEGEYDESERVIQQLLKENGATSLSRSTISVSAPGVEAAPDGENVRSPETYIGYERAENFASAEPIAAGFTQGLHSASQTFAESVDPGRKLEGESGKRCPSGSSGKGCVSLSCPRPAPGVGSSKDGKAVRFRVTLDGTPPGADHGSDTDATGAGKCRRTPSVSTHPAKGSRRGPDIRNRISRSRCTGICVHVWLIPMRTRRISACLHSAVLTWTS